MARGVVRGGLNDNNTSNIKSIQRGTTSATVSTTVTISAVNPTKSIVRVSYVPNNSGYLGKNLVIGVITNSTTITLSQYYTGGSAVSVAWEVIEFNNVKSIQSGLQSSNAVNCTVAISPINPSKSMLFCQHTSPSSSSLTVYYYQILQKYEITSPTVLTFTQYDTTWIGNQWHLVEFN